MEGEAFAAGTVINALATGKGCAFGLNLKTEVRISVENDLKRCITIENGIENENKMVDRILLSSGIKGVVEIKSEIPRGCGLGSSSAFMNALLTSAFKLRREKLDAYRILTANARISLEMGISYTGAFDDAAASLLGGFCLSDNMKMKLYRRDVIKGDAVVLIPRWARGKVCLEDIRKNPTEVEKAFKEAFDGNYMSAMASNSSYYCRILKYPMAPVETGFKKNIPVGLSGNGPAYVAFGNRKNLKEIENIWIDYGKVIRTELVTKPASDVQISENLFIRNIN